jgi:hypothetical protein
VEILGLATANSANTSRFPLRSGHGCFNLWGLWDRHSVSGTKSMNSYLGTKMAGWQILALFCHRPNWKLPKLPWCHLKDCWITHTNYLWLPRYTCILVMSLSCVRTPLLISVKCSHIGVSYTRLDSAHTSALLSAQQTTHKRSTLVSATKLNTNITHTCVQHRGRQYEPKTKTCNATI